MRPVKLQSLVDATDEANYKRWDDVFYRQVTRLGLWVYRLAIKGNLYTKKPSGEMVQIKVRRCSR